MRGAHRLLRVELYIHVVNTYDFAAVHIDHLLIKQVTLEQEQAFRTASCRPFRR